MGVRVDTVDMEEPVVSYCRSPWYIFWYADSGRHKLEQKLAIWGPTEETPLYLYGEVKTMLRNNDFTRIPGYNKIGDAGVLVQCLEQWVKDMDDKYPRRKRE